MSRKTSGKSSVLKRQRPKRGKTKPRPLGERLRRGALVTVVALAAAGAVYGLWRAKRAITQASEEAPPAWQISLKLADDTPLTATAQDEIIGTAAKVLGRGTRRELTRAAEAVQQLGSYADVHVVKLAPNAVAIQVRQRQPVLCIEADRLRLISSTEEVYGQVDTPAACPGPTVAGLFEPGQHPLMRNDLTLALGDNERSLVHEALELVRVGRDKGFVFSRLEVKKYRGFSVTLAGKDLEIALGRAPFAAKLEKLQGILDKLAQKNEQAVRIELDYQGKAFIKQKKM
jgi:hypothetical protein